MVKQTPVNKGFSMEEQLRNYFLRAGYYVVRGVPFVYEKFDITDIDLWLYGRASSVSREITIVDIKNKKTPQAIERIFWVQGLKIAVKATNAIVATTERRPEVKDFGKDLGVLVLDGSFLAKLPKVDEFAADRLMEEEFLAKIDEYSLGKLDGDWRGRMQLSKSLLTHGLSFDNCNEWLMHARFFAEQSIVKTAQRRTALRCLYLLCSYIAIALDFSLKEVFLLDQAEKSRLIEEGFTYGSKGRAGMQRILRVSLGLVAQHAPDGKLLARQVQSSVERELGSLNAATLGEYFSKTEVTKSLFRVAKEFEYLAMQRSFTSHFTVSIEAKSMLFCLLDFLGFSRDAFSDVDSLNEIEYSFPATSGITQS